MAGGIIKKKYLKKIKEGINIHQPEFESYLKRYFFKQTVNFITDKLMKSEIQKIERIRRRLSFECYLKYFLRNPIQLLTNLFFYLM